MCNLKQTYIKHILFSQIFIASFSQMTSTSKSMPVKSFKAQLYQNNQQNCLKVKIFSNVIEKFLQKIFYTSGLTLLDKKIQDQVSEHYEDFLNHSSGITTLENVIVMMQSHIQVKQLSIYLDNGKLIIFLIEGPVSIR